MRRALRRSPRSWRRGAPRPAQLNLDLKASGIELPLIELVRAAGLTGRGDMHGRQLGDVGRDPPRRAGIRAGLTMPRRSRRPRPVRCSALWYAWRAPRAARPVRRAARLVQPPSRDPAARAPAAPGGRRDLGLDRRPAARRSSGCAASRSTASAPTIPPATAGEDGSAGDRHDEGLVASAAADCRAVHRDVTEPRGVSQGLERTPVRPLSGVWAFRTQVETSPGPARCSVQAVDRLSRAVTGRGGGAAAGAPESVRHSRFRSLRAGRRPPRQPSASARWVPCAPFGPVPCARGALRSVLRRAAPSDRQRAAPVAPVAGPPVALSPAILAPATPVAPVAPFQRRARLLREVDGCDGAVLDVEAGDQPGPVRGARDAQHRHERGHDHDRLAAPSSPFEDVETRCSFVRVPRGCADRVPAASERAHRRIELSQERSGFECRSA